MKIAKTRGTPCLPAVGLLLLLGLLETASAQRDKDDNTRSDFIHFKRENGNPFATLRDHAPVNNHGKQEEATQDQTPMARPASTVPYGKRRVQCSLPDSDLGKIRKVNPGQDGVHGSASNAHRANTQSTTTIPPRKRTRRKDDKKDDKAPPPPPPHQAAITVRRGHDSCCWKSNLSTG